MKGDFFRFWRYILRFSLGCIIILEVALFFMNEETFLGLLEYQKNENTTLLELINNGLLILLALIITGTIGNLVLMVLIGFFDFINQLISRLLGFEKLKQLNAIAYIFLSCHQLCKIKLRSELDRFIEHFTLRSLGSPQPKEVIDRVMNYYQLVEEHIKGIKDADHYFTMIYQSALTQEQRNLDNLEWDVDSIKALIIAAELGVIHLLSLGYLNVWGYMLLALILLFMSIPALMNAKRKYSSYLVASTGAIFTLAEGAQIMDRDAI